MFKTIRVEGYRNLLTGDVELGPLNVLIGPNNSGKSNFLKALHFSADLSGGGQRPAGLADAVVSHKPESLRGWGWPKTRPLVLKWESDAEYPLGEVHATISHRVAFHLPVDRPFPTDFRVDEERFTVGTGPFAPLDLNWKPASQHIELSGDNGPTIVPAETLNAQNSMLLQAQAMLESDRLRTAVWRRASAAAKGWTADMKQQAAVRCSALDPARITKPVQTAVDERYLSADASNLANVLRHIDQTHGLKPIETALRDLVPDLERIVVYEGGGNQRWVRLEFEDASRFGKRKIDLWDMSDGTVQALIMATLLFSPEQPRLITIDEPELNLHPAWIGRVGTWMSEGGVDAQLVVSTHSPELLDAFTAAFVDGKANVFVLGGADAGALKPVLLGDVKRQLSEGWQLGDLYRVGDQSVGGWPW